MTERGVHAGGIDDRDAYCREIESYLCRKNDGHLIRIVGPAFEMVQGWAEAGIPLKLVHAAIDCTFERYYRHGPKRRPVHISFCEADVLDLFDDWRRALGLPMSGGEAESATASGGSHESLPAHLERVLNRLTLRRGGASCPPAADAVLERIVRELDAARPGARHLRGEGRAALIARLAGMDDEVMALAASLLSPEQHAHAVREADEDLDPFRERMAPEAYARARTTAIARAVRRAAGLPVVAYDKQ